MGEIIVTARRVRESLSRVPVSVVALGGEQLAARSLTSETDLQRNVPGLTVRSGQTGNFINFSMRGQSLDLFTGSRPAVLPYVNDVQLTTYSTSSFYDLDSIQALKGPQGTLFGRNATGGAVLYSTAKPTNTFEGFVTARGGNYGLREVEGAVNAPIVADKVLLRFAGDVEYRNGYQENIYLNTAHGQIRRQSGRLSLTLRPTDGIESTTVAQYSHSGGDNLQLETWSAYPCGATHNGIALPTVAGCLFGPTLDSAIGVPGAWDIYRSLHPGAQPGGILDQVAFQKALGPWQVNTFNPSKHRSDDWYVTNTSSYQIDSNLTLKNILGVAHAKSHDMYDAEGTGPYFLQGQDSSIDFNYGGPYTGVDNKTSQWSEELQLLGKAFEGSMDYITGFYAAYQRDGFFAPVSFIELRPFIPKTVQIDDFKSIDRTQAIYAQATQDLSALGVDNLKFTAGFRYTWEQVELAQGALATFQSLVNAPVNPAVMEERKHFSDPSWTVGLDYQATPALMLYVTNRGSWRSGGFNGTGPARFGTAAEGGNLFNPETTYDVEAGAKYSGVIARAPAHFNLAVYNQWVSNVQRVIYTTPPAEFAVGGTPGLQALTVNIPNAQVTGVEADGSVTPVDWLQLGGNVAYTDARFTDGTSVLFGQSLTYGPYADTPRWAGTVYVQVGLPVPEDLGAMTFRGDVYAQSSQYFSNLAATVAPDTLLPGYQLLNFRLDWRNVRRSGVSLAAFAKNVTNRGYYTGGIALIPFGQNGVIPGEPRMYGIEATARF